MSLCPVAHKRKRKSAPTARISNDVGRCQDTPSPFRPPEPALNSKESAEAAVARSSRSALSTLHARSVSLHHDGVTHQTSLRSPADHDDACELPPSEGGGSPSQCCGHSRTTTRADTGIPARTPPLRLPRQPTTAELCVVNLIAQHDPESNAQFSRRRDARLGESLLRDLSTIEALQVGIPSHRMGGRLAPEKPQERVALFAERSEALPFTTRVLARDHADVARQRLSVENSCGIAHEDFCRECGDGPDARMGHQQRGSRALLRDVLDLLVESIDVLIQVLIQRLE